MSQTRSYHPTIPILVINDERDDSPSIDGATVLANSGSGVTAAWNTGVRASGTAHILLLNNDVGCQGPFAGELIEAAPRGISGVSWRHERRLHRRLLEGWCLCFSRRLWEHLGGFDERFAIYYSDTDFQHRAVQAGYTLSQCEVPLTHQHAATSNDRTLLPNKMRIHRKDRQAFMEKHGLR